MCIYIYVYINRYINKYLNKNIYIYTHIYREYEHPKRSKSLPPFTTG